MIRSDHVHPTTCKPVKPDYKASPPTQAPAPPAPHIIKRREAPSYIPPPPPIHIYQQPQVEQLAAPFYNPPLKPSYNPPDEILKAAAPVYKPPAKPSYNPPARQSY